MNEIDTIIAAVLGGVASATTESVSAAVKDMYAGFKIRLRTLLHGNNEAENALSALESGETSHSAILTEVLTRVERKELHQLAQLASTLLSHLELDKKRDEYNIKIKGNVTNLIQGDRARVDIKMIDPQ